MSSGTPVLVLCNNASAPDGYSGDGDAIVLNYLDSAGDLAKVIIGLPNFVRDVYHLPDRTLDLLEIAAYVYCADRMKVADRKMPWNTMPGQDRSTSW